ncbi:MAG: DUF86 domain-containing protein [Planctomycetes bacterium]|nr:DUF86 domain-containing protein [Planctomycetota bacterium]
MKPDGVYLSHMRDAIAKIERYLAAVDYETFAGNDMMIDAVVRELEIIGEAARNLSGPFIEQHPDIPWSRIKRMWNILIHEYFGVSLKVVWDTTHSNLPQLKMFIQNILAEEEQDEGTTS